jgi:lipase
VTLISSRAVGVATTREARGRVPGDGITMAFGFWPGAGAPIVALHGVTASYINFVGVADRLAGRRPLLALDLRGRGDTDKPSEGPFGMAQHARDVAAAMSAFGIDDAVVIGHSMGAYVAAALAAEHPERVRGVVMVDGGLPLEAPPGIAPEQMLDVALAPQMARLRSEFVSYEAYLDASVRGDFLDSLQGDQLRGWLKAIRVPVLLLRATEGFNPDTPPLLPDGTVAVEGSAIADLTDRVIDGTTHYTIALGDPGATAVADQLVDWAETCGR